MLSTSPNYGLLATWIPGESSVSDFVRKLVSTTDHSDDDYLSQYPIGLWDLKEVIEVKILCVDDEPKILEAYQRSLRKRFQIETATSGPQGLDAIRTSGPFAVVVTDMRMPVMDGVQFLAKVKEKAPDTVRIMLTGNTDQQSAIDAVNQGHIFRFLTKPCSPEMLAHTLVAGIEQYRLITAEKELLQQTLTGSVKILTDILTLVNPTAFSRASRVRRLASQICVQLGIENAWQVEIAAMLSQVGCITVPEETLTKVSLGRTLTSEETRMFEAHPKIGHDLIARIPRLEPVAEIIAYQEKMYDGQGIPHDDIAGDRIPLGARIIKVALDFDRLRAKQIGAAEAFREVRGKQDRYDPAVIEALSAVLSDEIKYDIQRVKVSELTLNMILAENVVSSKGLVLVTEGQEVTPYLQKRLQNLANAIRQPIAVRVPVNGA